MMAHVRAAAQKSAILIARTDNTVELSCQRVLH